MSLNLSSDEKEFYDHLFDKADAKGRGYVKGKHIKNIMKASQLPDKVLHKVWAWYGHEPSVESRPDIMCHVVHVVSCGLRRYGSTRSRTKRSKRFREATSIVPVD